MVQIDQARTSEASAHDNPRIRSLEASSAADDIGLTMALTAGHISNRLDEYSLVRTHLPGVWQRHLDGQIDGWRLHVIAEAATELHEPANLTLLDENLTGWLDQGLRTPGQLGAWLHRQIARLEPEHQRERKESAWQQRRADISHDHTDGTAHLFSVLSADDGIAIQDMIDQLARDRANQTEGLTAQQARADVIADILLGRITLDGSDTGTTRVQARIGVMVPITTLAGLAQTPGTSSDRQTSLDAQTVRKLAALPGALFRRLLTDPAGDNLLEVTATAYNAPDRLREAIVWRDGVCAFPTCQHPANNSDLDHIEPWPAGQTTASNLQFICRRHHRLKTHGLLPVRDPT